MKVVVAPNAFKDSLSADAAAQAITRGVLRVVPDAETVHVPIADGGDGLFDVFKSVFGGETITKEVTGPLGKPVAAEILYIPDTKTAVVEMARASGLALLRPEERDARSTTSRGTGELVLEAIRKGATKILVGIGGSATNDGGMGFASALGVRFLDTDGNDVRPIGEDLGSVASVDVSGLSFDPASVSFEAVCDVDNPLTGERGAAAVFGPQKGATPEDVTFLDAGLANLAKRTRECLGKDLEAMSGAGAAGGLGFGLAAYVDAALRPGVDVVLDMVGIDNELEGADLSITAEGRIDFQTAFGKGPAGVGARSKRKGVPCIALAGGLLGDISNLHDIGIDACFSLCSAPMSLDDAMKNGAELLEAATEQAVRAFLAGRAARG
ncbi:MAG: glycerate kinase [Planctomycetaceae bacterium]|nr:glycerate kinase [Planctomycetaceae bacterium]